MNMDYWNFYLLFINMVQQKDPVFKFHYHHRTCREPEDTMSETNEKKASFLPCVCKQPQV